MSNSEKCVIFLCAWISFKNSVWCCVTGSLLCSLWRIYSGNRWYLHILVFTCCLVSLTTECTVCQAQGLAGHLWAAHLYNTIIQCSQIHLTNFQVPEWKSHAKTQPFAAPLNVTLSDSLYILPWSKGTALVKVILYAHAIRRSELA